MQFGPLTLKRCRYGWMLFSGLHIGASFDTYGEYSESEVAMLRRFVRPGDTVIDVGANIADLTLPLSQMVGSNGMVYAIESQPDTFNVLCGNLALNQVGNVTPLNVFLKVGEDAIVRPQFVRANRDTPFITLDSLGLASCRLLKIDVDGNERDVIQSGAALIAKHRPILYFENDIRAVSAPLLAAVLGLGYRLFWHLAPLFNPNNFFGKEDNIWAPQNVVSPMILGLPQESNEPVPDGLFEITAPDSWWLDLVATA